MSNNPKRDAKEEEEDVDDDDEDDEEFEGTSITSRHKLYDTQLDFVIKNCMGVPEPNIYRHCMVILHQHHCNTFTAEVGDEDDDDVEDDEEDDDDEGDDEEEEVPGGPTMADLMSGKYVRTKYLFLSPSFATC